MISKPAKFIFLGFIFIIFYVLFICQDLQADIGYMYWRFVLIKMHLLQEWAIPYFTPARCGGWLLAAEAQDLIFSIYMAMHFLIPNIFWAIKISHFILVWVLFFGIFVWLKSFGVIHTVARGFAAFFLTISGYWVLHTAFGSHVDGHGFAYTPWVMILIEYFLAENPRWEKRYVYRLWGLLALFFLLINSGYYWLQVFWPIMAIRIFVEGIFSFRNFPVFFKRLSVITAAGLSALLLSWPRLGGIYEFQLTKFTRGGDPTGPPILPVMEFLGYLHRSFFDASVIVNNIDQALSGGYWDHSNFLGMFAMIPIVFAFARTKKMLSNKSFLGLLLASFFQYNLITSEWFLESVKTVFPLFKSLGYHWRGTGIIVLFLTVLMAYGYEYLLMHRRRVINVFICLIFFLNVVEIFQAYSTRIVWQVNPPYSEILKQDPPLPEKPMLRNWAPCKLEHIYGMPFPEQLGGIGERGEAWADCTDENYFCLHDVRRFAVPEANHGYYKIHPWPRWPKADTAEFEKFINYKQVVSLPARLKVLNFISMIFWLACLLGWLFVWRYFRNRKSISAPSSEAVEESRPDVPISSSGLARGVPWIVGGLICLITFLFYYHPAYRRIGPPLSENFVMRKFILDPYFKHIKRTQLDTINKSIPEWDGMMDCIKSKDARGCAKIEQYVSYYETLTCILPQPASAYEFGGYFYYKQGKIRQAIEAYERAISADPDFFWSNYNLGILYYRNKQYGTAAHFLKKALQVQPHKTLQHMVSGRLYVEMITLLGPYGYDINKNLLEAKANAHMVLAVNYKHLKNFSAMEETVMAALNTKLFPKQNFYFLAGVAAYEQKESTKAQLFFKKAVEEGMDQRRLMRLIPSVDDLVTESVDLKPF